MEKQKSLRKQAFLFIILLGIISMLSDFTHEGARSLYGNYLGILGVSAFLISLTSGLGELIGQALRIFTGVLADKTKKYWTMMILGYSVNLLVIPLLMFVNANIWQVAIILILLERVGKGIRAPAKSALASFTAPHLGAGKAFAIQEALDQFGAFLGPIFVYLVLSFHSGTALSGYQLSFGLLGIFAILTLTVLVIARFKYPNPDTFEIKTIEKGFKGNHYFILYMVAISFIALGFIDYPLIAYHIGELNLFDIKYIPLLYALAMGVDAMSALFFGYLFDKIGIKSLQISMGLALFFAPVIFLTSSEVAIVIGVIIWGIGMGAQESILKSVVAKIVSKEKRATAYGIFSSVFGIAWFLGSTFIGLIYSNYLFIAVIFSVVMEMISVILLIILEKKLNQHIFVSE